MNLWRVAELGAIGAAVLVGGAAAGVAASWLLARAARRWGTDNLVLRPPVSRFPKLSADEADDVREEARRRAALVAEHVGQSAQIASGTPPEPKVRPFDRFAPPPPPNQKIKKGFR